MLNAIEVTKKYGKTLACDNVSFQVDDGSITVLLGPNGQGKSTIIKSIIGFLRFDGQIEIDGFPCKKLAAKDCSICPRNSRPLPQSDGFGTHGVCRARIQAERI